MSMSDSRVAVTLLLMPPRQQKTVLSPGTRANWSTKAGSLADTISSPRRFAASTPACTYSVPTSARSPSSKSGMFRLPGMVASANSPGDRTSMGTVPPRHRPSFSSSTVMSRIAASPFFVVGSNNHNAPFSRARHVTDHGRLHARRHQRLQQPFGLRGVHGDEQPAARDGV